MKSTKVLAVAGLAVALAIQTGAVQAAPSRKVTLRAGESKTWADGSLWGLNLSHELPGGTPGANACGSNIQDLCDETLVEVLNPVDSTTCLDHPEEQLTRRLKFHMDYAYRLTPPFPTDPIPKDDFDVNIYASDPSGARGDRLYKSELSPEEIIAYEDRWETDVTTSCAEPARHYLVEVVFARTSILGGFTVEMMF